MAEAVATSFTEQFKRPLDYCLESYEDVSYLGRGNFGIVFKATRKDTREVVAVKRAKIHRRVGTRSEQIWSYLCQQTVHPNIIAIRFYHSGNRFKDWADFDKLCGIKDISTIDSEKCYINAKTTSWKEEHSCFDDQRRTERVDLSADGVGYHTCVYEMELCLKSVEQMNADGDLTDDLIVPLLRDVACGLAYLHLLGTTHGDLHLGNILFTNSRNFKLSDFGQAAFNQHGSTKRDVTFYMFSLLVTYTHNFSSSPSHILKCLDKFSTYLKLEQSHTPTSYLLYLDALATFREFTSEALVSETAAEDCPVGCQVHCFVKNDNPHEETASGSQNKINASFPPLDSALCRNALQNSSPPGLSKLLLSETGEAATVSLLNIAAAAQNVDYFDRLISNISAHSNGKFADLLTKQIDSLGHSTLFYTIVGLVPLKLVKILCEVCGYQYRLKQFVMNTGIQKEYLHNYMLLPGVDWSLFQQFINCVEVASIISRCDIVSYFMSLLPSELKGIVNNFNLRAVMAILWNNEMCLHLTRSAGLEDINKRNNYGRTLLHVAIEADNAELVYQLLDIQTIDVNIQDNEDLTPLSLAIFKGQTEIGLRLLSLPGCDFTVPVNKSTTLHLAAHCNNVEIARKLIELDCENSMKNALDENGFSPLFIAICQNSLCVVNQLTACSAVDVNQQLNFPFKIETTDIILDLCPLSFAIVDGNVEIADILIKCPRTDLNKKNDVGRTPLILGVIYNRPEIVAKLASEDNVDMNIQDKDGVSALIAASIRGYFEIAETLLKSSRTNLELTDVCGRSALTISIINSHQDIVRLLASNDNTVVNTIDKNGYTPLMIALFQKNSAAALAILSVPECNVWFSNSRTLRSCLHLVNDLTVARTLTSTEGINEHINDEDIDGNTPLMCCLINGHEDIALHFLPFAACNYWSGNINTNLSPLHLAVQFNHPRVIAKLITMPKTCLNAKESKGEYTPLLIAVTKKLTTICELLLQVDKVDVNAKNSEGVAALAMAVAMDDVQIVDLLLKRQDIDINCLDNNGTSSFVFALIHHSFESAKKLLLHPTFDFLYRLNKSQSTILHIVAELGSVDLADAVLVKTLENLNSRDCAGNTPLMSAIINNNAPVAELILGQHSSNKADVHLNTKNNLGRTSLMLAILQIDLKIDIITMLIDNPVVSLNTLDNSGNSALMYAIAAKKEAARLLIKSKRCDINLGNSVSNNSPLLAALSYGQVELVELLLSRDDCELAATNNHDNSPLQLACGGGFVEVARTLLDKCPSNLNLRDADGDTPLIEAVANNQLSIVELLLSYPKIDTSVCNKKGSNALSLAKDLGYLQLVEILSK